MKYIKNLKKDEIIIGILFIVISVVSVIFLEWKGLILIPIMLILIIIYLNIDRIINYINKKVKKKDVASYNDKAIKLDKIEEGVIMKKVNKKSTKKKVKMVKEKKGAKNKKRKWWKKLLTLILTLGIIGVIAVAAFLLYIVSSAGTFNPDALSYQDQTVIYDVNGEEIATLGREKRESITYDKLPQVLIDAIIATEDSRFIQHNGVDMARFIKATIGQVIGNSSAGGASTLTMQVVKNNLTSTEKSIIRKFKDIYLSVFFVEKKYTKEEILEFYVNDSLLGGSVFGVEEASQYYFGKSVSELSLPEASLIAGLFQSPNGYNPYRYPEKAEKRRATVLKLMVRHEYITQEEADFANSIPIESLLADNSEDGIYQGYIDTVVDEVKEKTGFDPALVSMKIYTTMNRNIQNGIDDILNGKAYTWVDDKIQAGIAITDVDTGAIVAIGAGRNRVGERQWNYATMTKRQPGSTSKPLFDYGPGFEYNNFSTYTLFYDEPWNYTNGPEVNNWNNTFDGLMTLRTAVAVSRNIPALKAFQQINKKSILNFVRGLGLDPDLEYGALHEAYAIGGGDGFTPLEMAVAYATFANGGYHIEPYCVTKIEYRSTGEIEEYKYKKERVMAESTSFLMNNILQYAAEYGFSGGSRVWGSTVAAKTGTTNIDSTIAKKRGIPDSAIVDLWTCAYTPEFSVSLWYGYEELTKEYYLDGNNAPKDSLMASIMKHVPKTTKTWNIPDTVVASKVEFGTWPAQLPSEFTPSDLIKTEYFIKGTQPIEVSERYDKLDRVTNVKTTTASDGIKLTWNYTSPSVITESYLKDFYSQSIFGKGTDDLVKDRLQYNINVLGDFGFGIYIQKNDIADNEENDEEEENTSDNLERIAFTTDNEYVYSNVGFEGNQNVTLVIKAEYEKFKKNASDGVTKQISIAGIGNKLSLNIGSSTVTVNKGNYVHTSEIITYDNENVSSKVPIIYKLTNTSNIVNITKNNSDDITTEINKLEVGTYSLTYTINYKGETITKKKTIIIKI